jgi:7-keto-8-aminopelargonate synthetase-like enzyme
MRSHGSGPSAAAYAAIGCALADGDRREMVLKLVGLFRNMLWRHGLPEPDGGDWPMQTIPVQDALRVRDALLDKGIRAVPVHRRCRPGIGLAFLITARHTPADLERAVSALVEAL